LVPNSQSKVFSLRPITHFKTCIGNNLNNYNNYHNDRGRKADKFNTPTLSFSVLKVGLFWLRTRQNFSMLISFILELCKYVSNNPIAQCDYFLAFGFHFEQLKLLRLRKIRTFSRIFDCKCSISSTMKKITENTTKLNHNN